MFLRGESTSLKWETRWENSLLFDIRYVSNFYGCSRQL